MTRQLVEEGRLKGYVSESNGRMRRISVLKICRIRMRLNQMVLVVQHGFSFDSKLNILMFVPDKFILLNIIDRASIKENMFLINSRNKKIIFGIVATEFFSIKKEPPSKNHKLKSKK